MTLASFGRVSAATSPPVELQSQPAATAAPPAVSIADVSKAFRIPHQRYHTLKERALHPLRSRGFDVLHAVDHVNVDIATGEFFGIVGRNGSGKSTLLKCLAGIYRIDSGELQVHGRLSPFIELGVGFNMDLTARDNVMINAIMLGLTRKQARERFDRIIEFAELGEFLDLKLKNYSSGMMVRLAFSVAIQVDAEILLIDEVLAVGDAAFQQKCFDEFEALKRQGKTIVFVTHDMSAVERFCHRAMLLERGKMLAIGAPELIARRYREINFGTLVHAPPAERTGDQDQVGASILGAWFENEQGERINDLEHGERCVACMEVRMNEALEEPIFGVTIRNDAGATVFSTASQFSAFSSGSFRPSETAIVRLRFENWLTPSRYLLSPSIARNGTGEATLDVWEDAAELIVHGGHFTGAVVNLPHEFQLERR
jgi:ABC-type polysaccharide/polyol phosphate transport system ATPase subunit